MKSLEEILDMWDEDSKIRKSNKQDIISAQQAAAECGQLHAKYLRMLAEAKLKLEKVVLEQNNLMKDKWLWYNGKLSQEEIEKLGWNPDPFNGLKMLKGEMDYYIKADPELNAVEAKIKYIKTIIETLESILTSIQWRNNNIRNVIDAVKFQAGF